MTETELSGINETDELTGLYTERAFVLRVKNEIETHPENEYAMLCVDIDRFKLFNDTYGIEAGNDFLRSLGTYIADIYSGKAVIGHLYADNFAVFLPCVIFNSGKLLKKLSSFLDTYIEGYKPICSIGIYLTRNRTEEIRLMMDRAKTALKSAKGSYASNYAYYDEKQWDNLINEQFIINCAKTAIADNQFVLFYQPICNYTTGELVGAEALVRWIHPTEGMIYPGVFIPIFERNGFISELDMYIVENVCRHISKSVYAKQIPISVNLSRTTVQISRIWEKISAVVDKYNVPHNMIKFEVTESAYITTPTRIISAVEELQKLGFDVMMDDFGSGYSSLNSLKDLPVDILKIDMKFIAEAEEKARAESILRSVITMMRRMGIPIICEGIETKHQAEFLHSLGCSLMQGYFFSFPVCPKMFEKIAAEKLIGSISRVAAPAAVETPFVYVGGKCCNISKLNAGIDRGTDGTPDILYNLPLGAGLYLIDDSGILKALYLSDTALEIFGYNRRDVAGFTDDDENGKFDIALGSDNLPDDEKILRREKFELTVRIMTRSAEAERVHLYACPLFSHNGMKICYVLMDKVQAGFSGESSDEHYRVLMANSDISTFEYNCTDDIFTLFYYKNGVTEKKVYEKYSEGLREGKYISGEYIASALEIISRCSREACSGTFTYLSGHGTQRWNSTYYVSIPSENGGFYIAGRISDIHKDMSEIKRLREMVQTDTLTGVWNRAALEQWFEKFFGRDIRYHRGAFFLIDLDNFKIVNDSLGHLAGDALLRSTANRLASVLRTNDIVCRYGGDEFVVFINGIVETDTACRKAEQINNAIDSIHVPDMGKVRCSIGVTMVSESDRCFGDVFSRADIALYSAKKRGKNRYIIFENINGDNICKPHDVECLSGKNLLDDKADRYTVFFSISEIVRHAGTQDEAIMDMIAYVGNMFEASRMYLMIENSENGCLSMSYEWCAEGIQSISQKIPSIFSASDKEAYWKNFDLSGIYYIEDTDTLPSAEKKYSAVHPSKSFVQCIVYNAGKRIGIVGCHSCTSRVIFTRRHTDTLTLLSSFISALMIN